MGNNTQSTQPRHELSSSLSLDDGASDFAEGEYVLLGIPDSIVVDGHLRDEATADMAHPPTSKGSSPQNFAFICQMNILLDGDWVLEVYPVVSFTSSGGALRGYDLINDAAKATLLPLPPLSIQTLKKCKETAHICLQTGAVESTEQSRTNVKDRCERTPLSVRSCAYTRPPFAARPC